MNTLTGGDYCPNCDTGHITFYCLNHSEKRWSGKNIAGRSMFYNLDHVPGMGASCDCVTLVHHCPVDGKVYRNRDNVIDNPVLPIPVPVRTQAELD
jgi:hypothetical protein